MLIINYLRAFLNFRNCRIIFLMIYLAINGSEVKALELPFDDAVSQLKTEIVAKSGELGVKQWPISYQGGVRVVGYINKVLLTDAADLQLVVDQKRIKSFKIEPSSPNRIGFDFVINDLSPLSSVKFELKGGKATVRIAVQAQALPEPFVSRWSEILPYGYPKWKEEERNQLRAKGQAILQVIIDASKNKQKKVVIPPGEYLFHANWSKESTLSDLADLEIIAHGVTFWFEPPLIHGLLFKNCRRVILRGLTIDFTLPCWFQARVTEIDRDSKQVRAKFINGYEARDANGKLETAGNRALMFYDSEGGFINSRHSPGDWAVTNSSDGSLLCQNIKRAGIPAKLRIGDYVVGTLRTGAALRSMECEAMRYEDIQIWSSPGMAVWEGGGVGGNIYHRVRATRRPDTNRLHSFGADIFHLAGADIGPTLDRCELAYGADDNLNIHGKFGRVVKKSDEKSYYLDGSYNVGDTLEFWDQVSVELRGVSKVLSVKKIEDGPSVAINDKYTAKGEVLVTMDRALDLQPLTLVVGGNRSAKGFIVRNCWLHDNFQRTLINGSPNGLIENNTLQNVGHGIIVMFETHGPWMEGPFARNLVIRHNRFLDSPPDDSSIRVCMQPPKGTSYDRRFTSHPVTNLTIHDNFFGRTTGVPIIIHNVSGLRIENNSFDYPENAVIPTGLAPNPSPVNWLYLQDCENFFIKENSTAGADKNWKNEAIHTKTDST